MMDNVINFPASGPITDRYREMKSYTEQGEDMRILLATKDGDDTAVHITLLGDGFFEVIASYANTETGRAIADAIGAACDKTLFYSAIYGDEEA